MIVLGPAYKIQIFRCLISRHHILKDWYLELLEENTASFLVLKDLCLQETTLSQDEVQGHPVNLTLLILAITLICSAPFKFSDAFGLRLVHGEIPGSLGRYGCVISHIFAGSYIEAVEDIYEGDEVVEINGIPMAEKSDDEIQLIVGTIREDMELCTRSYSTRNHEMIEMSNHGLYFTSSMSFIYKNIYLQPLPFAYKYLHAVCSYM